MWFCARCGNRKPSPLSECATCAQAPAGSSRCPTCGVDVPGPPVMGRLSCPACKNEFGDYAAWLAQCRADAYAAHPAPSHTPPFQPGPPPPHLRNVAIGFLVCAPVQILGGVIVPDVLIPCLLLAALQIAAGLALLKKLPGADGWARLAAGLSTLVPVLVVPALYCLWAFYYFCRPPATSHYGPPPEGAPPASRARTLLLLFALVVAGLLTYIVLVTPAIRTAYAWEEPLSGALGAAHEVFHYYLRHSTTIILGGLGGFLVLGLLGTIRRRPFFRIAGLAALALLVLGPALGVPAVAFRREAARAEALRLETDLNRLLWAIQEPDAKMRLAAARRLEALGRDARTSVPALEKALEDVDTRVRGAAARALSVIQPRSDRAVQVLVDAFKSHRADVDGLTAALLRFGPRARPAMPYLLATLPASAVPLLAEIGSPAVPGLIEALGRTSPDARRRALEVLRRIGPDARAAAPAVEAAMRDADLSVASEATRAFGAIQRDKALSPLFDLVRGDSPLRPAAAEALCALGEREGLMGHPRPGNHLNAVRRPAQWDHLRRQPVDEDLEGETGAILDILAGRALMCVDPSPALPLSTYRRLYGASRRRSALDLILSLDVDFVLEEDRIRVLTPAQAQEFWTKWVFEAMADRSR